MIMTDDRQPRRRALIVEDSFVVAWMLEDTLAERGFEVVGPMAKLEQAVHAARTERLDLAIVDVNLQGEEAYPVVDLLVERSTPVIVATGYGLETVPARYRDLPRLEKPFVAEDVVSTLARVVPPS